MTPDPALEWLLADAKSQGLTVSEYERRYGVILQAPNPRTPYAAEHAIRDNEIVAGLMTDDDVSLAAEKSRLRSRESV